MLTSDQIIDEPVNTTIEQIVDPKHRLIYELKGTPMVLDAQEAQSMEGLVTLLRLGYIMPMLAVELERTSTQYFLDMICIKPIAIRETSSTRKETRWIQTEPVLNFRSLHDIHLEYPSHIDFYFSATLKWAFEQLVKSQ
jgi:hypothetical protein